MKNCALIHDLCTYSKASLTVAIPLLESLGIEACPFPTAILSTQTDGFENYFLYDLDNILDNILDNLLDVNVVFDGIYSGFLANTRTIDFVKRLITSSKNNPIVIIDPVMGDNGELYGPFDDSYINEMRNLITFSDIITPNITEVEFLLGTKHKSFYSKTEIKEMSFLLSKILRKKKTNFAITGISLEEAKNKITVAYGNKDELNFISHDNIEASFSGTGDMFASILTGLVLRGMSFNQAVCKAALLTAKAVSNSKKLSRVHRQGVSTSSIIPYFFKDNEILELVSNHN